MFTGNYPIFMAFVNRCGKQEEVYELHGDNLDSK